MVEPRPRTRPPYSRNQLDAANQDIFYIQQQQQQQQLKSQQLQRPQPQSQKQLLQEGVEPQVPLSFISPLVRDHSDNR